MFFKKSNSVIQKFIKIRYHDFPETENWVLQSSTFVLVFSLPPCTLSYKYPVQSDNGSNRGIKYGSDQLPFGCAFAYAGITEEMELKGFSYTEKKDIVYILTKQLSIVIFINPFLYIVCTDIYNNLLIVLDLKR